MRWIIGVMILLLWPFAVRAEVTELRILTSYDAEVIAPIAEAFSAAHPEIQLRHLNKNTNAAVTELLSGNSRRFDLFWASAPEAFAVLANAGRLVDLGHGPHVDFAYSAVGWAWQSPAGHPVPQDWNDLLNPVHAGRIAMSHPMRSGTTHSLIETILQDRGWQAGWAWLLELSGQLNTISARSFGVLEGLGQSRYDVGLTIDFLALKRSGSGIVFRYGRPIIIIPARLGALNGGRHPEAARSFIDFVLSQEGQRLLLRPDIRRIPVNEAVRAELAETLRPEVRAALQFSWSRYDPDLASRRYWQVNEVFEAFIGRDFLRRRDLWRRWHALAGSNTPETSSLRAMLTHMPISETAALAAPDHRTTLLAWQAESQRILDAIESRLSAIESRR
ncbi:MAG: substrate-binding domain-containing protein [Gemmobacter sp.]|nr:substrate-binding domain-containing protein [Gemmobacter sp.]